MQIRNDIAIIQKLNEPSFMSRRYEVPLSSIYPVLTEEPTYHPTNHFIESESDDEEEEIPSPDNEIVENDLPAIILPQRNRHEPEWLRDDIWDRS